MRALVGVSAVVILGVVLWLLLGGDDPGADQASTAVDAAAAPGAPSEFLPLDPVPASAPGTHLAKEARVLEAIAHGMQQRPDAGEEVLVSQPPTAQQRRARKLHIRGTSRQLMRVVRDCLRDVVKANPALSNPEHKVVLTVSPDEAAGAVVSKFKMVGPGGNFRAPDMNHCLANKLDALQLKAAPIMPGSDQPIEYSFPLITPTGTQ